MDAHAAQIIADWFWKIVGAFVSVAVIAASWLVHLERRMGGKVDKESYQADMRRLEEKSDARTEYMHMFKHDMDDHLHGINLKVELMGAELKRCIEDVKTAINAK